MVLPFQNSQNFSCVCTNISGKVYIIDIPGLLIVKVLALQIIGYQSLK